MAHKGCLGECNRKQFIILLRQDPKCSNIAALLMDSACTVTECREVGFGLCYSTLEVLRCSDPIIPKFLSDIRELQSEKGLFFSLLGYSGLTECGFGFRACLGAVNPRCWAHCSLSSYMDRCLNLS